MASTLAPFAMIPIMNEAVVVNILSIELTESQVAILERMGITIEMLFGVAVNSDQASMALYIHSLLASNGDYELIAGPMIDPFSGNNG